MLRIVVLGFCGAAILCGAVALALGIYPPAAIFGLWGLVLAVGTLFEQVIYKRIQPASPGPGWERTPEQFIDDQTGKPVTVYVQSATGERVYVQE